ncbi:MAG: type II toxin-antitoxin system Phd/YefM family antitoxin [Candidatus Nanopelagicales bacterium]
MKTVPMTQLNQHPNEVTRLVEAGEVVQVTRHGRPVLRMVPEPTATDPLGPLMAAGVLTPPTGPCHAPQRQLPLLSPEEADAALAWLTSDADA